MSGATPLRRYAEWHGVSDEHIRGLLTWIMISGFLGAHEFDVVAYQWDRIGDATVRAPASWWFLPQSLWRPTWPLPPRVVSRTPSHAAFIARPALLPGKVTFPPPLYRFGAMLSFPLAHASVIPLRRKHAGGDIPWKARPNLHWRGVDGPIFAIIGLLCTGLSWLDLVHQYQSTH